MPERLRIFRKKQGSAEADAAAAHRPSVDRDAVNTVLSRSPAQPLNAGVQQRMETQFGYDFSQVRVHTDAEASRSAADLNARAYTVGPDIVFGDGAYSPASSDGQRLIAHELTHVVQQANGAIPAPPASTSLAVSQPGDALEQSADQTASQVMAAPSPAAALPAAPAAAVMREEDEPEEEPELPVPEEELEEEE